MKPSIFQNNVISSMFWTSKQFASAGNRTRAARVAGEHSTTEPPMQTLISISNVGVDLLGGVLKSKVISTASIK